MEELLINYLSTFNAFNEEEIKAVVDNMQLTSFQKGTILQEEGKVCHRCFFIIEGCLRQYQLVNGTEKTTAFFTEGQAVVLYSSYLEKAPSDYSLSCTEDSILAIGSRKQEQTLHEQFPKLKYLTHTLLPQDYAKVQERMTLLSNYTPEERYVWLLETQPSLLNRVPLHQIASFIGVTPESFSRIRKRVVYKAKIE